MGKQQRDKFNKKKMRGAQQHARHIQGLQKGKEKRREKLYQPQKQTKKAVFRNHLLMRYNKFSLALSNINNNLDLTSKTI